MLRKIRFTLLYFGKPRWDTGISPPELLEFIESHAPGRALDLGCGTGTNAITLAKHGWRVTGVDFVGKAIRSAERKAKQAALKIDFYTQDVTHLENLTAPFDLILDIGCLHSLAHEARISYLNNVRRLLAPDGTYLLYAFINGPSDIDAPGLSEADLQHIQSSLQLKSRTDGSDHHQRQSAWFTYTQIGEHP